MTRTSHQERQGVLEAAMGVRGNSEMYDIYIETSGLFILLLILIFYRQIYHIKKERNKAFLFFMWESAIFCTLDIAISCIYNWGGTSQRDWINVLFIPYYLSVAYLILYLFYIMGFLIIKRKEIAPRHHFLHIVMLVTDFAIIILQLQFRHFRLDAIALVFTVIISLFSFETPDYMELKATLEELRKRREKEAIARAEAEKANKDKEHFLSNMSHQIRTPLNAIIGLDEMLLRESKEANVRDYASKMKESSDLLLATIEDILDFSKIESGDLDIVEKEYDVVEMVSSILNLISLRAKEKGLKLSLETGHDIPRYLIGDSVRIRQVITNILTNAVKYTKEGSVTFSISGHREESFYDIRIAVKDTGIGIKKEDIHKLYGDYERIESDGNHFIEGTGIGMTITMSILRLMDSNLVVESEYGVGSCFSFTIRQKLSRDEIVKDFREALNSRTDNYKYTVSFSAPKARILSVDDKKLNLFVIEKLLKTTKVGIKSVLSGKDAIEELEKNHYDLILLDHMMPDMDGIEVLHYIWDNNLCPDTPVIVFTANAMTGVEEMYLKEGFSAYLSKPVKKEALEACILDFLPEDLIEDPVEDEEIAELSDENQLVLKRLGEDKFIDAQVGIGGFSDKEDYIETLRRFAMSFEKNKKEIENLQIRINIGREVIPETIDSYRIAVHSMKSSSALVGYIKLSDICSKQEDAAREVDKSRIKKQSPTLVMALEKTNLSLNDIFRDILNKPSTESGEDKKLENPAIVIALLEMLKTAAVDLDLDAMDQGYEKLKNQKLPGSYQEKLMNLEQAVNDINVDEVIKIVGEIEEAVKGGEGKHE